MITASVDMTGFNKGMAGLVSKTKLTMKQVLKKETGELIKTLVRVSPPADRRKTADNIAGGVNSKFDSLNQEVTFTKGTASKAFPNTTWTAVTNYYLFGAGREKDMRKANTLQLREVYYRTKVSRGVASQVFNFAHPRKKQRVRISQRLLTTVQKGDSLIKRIQKNIGRLKAGWLVAVKAGAIQLLGSQYTPPNWVTQHLNRGQPRGSYINGLGSEKTPSFTIINYAKGIGQKDVNYLVKTAVAIRVKAMRINAALLYSGKKKLSSYQ